MPYYNYLGQLMSETPVETGNILGTPAGDERVVVHDLGALLDECPGWHGVSPSLPVLRRAGDSLLFAAERFGNGEIARAAKSKLSSGPPLFRRRPELGVLGGFMHGCG